MDWLTSFFAWYNLPFLIPLLMVVIYMIIHIIGFGWNGGAGLDIGDIAVSIDDESKDDIHRYRPLTSILGFLNISGIPLTMLAGIFVISWGIEGVVVNYAIKGANDEFPPLMLLLSMGVSLIISVGVVKLFSVGLGLFAPSSGEGQRAYADLVGVTASVVVAPGKSIGKARITDSGDRKSVV